MVQYAGHCVSMCEGGVRLCGDSVRTIMGLHYRTSCNENNTSVYGHSTAMNIHRQCVVCTAYSSVGGGGLTTQQHSQNNSQRL